jgi:hypothetical protein
VEPRLGRAALFETGHWPGLACGTALIDQESNDGCWPSSGLVYAFLLSAARASVGRWFEWPGVMTLSQLQLKRSLDDFGAEHGECIPRFALRASGKWMGIDP